MPPEPLISSDVEYFLDNSDYQFVVYLAAGLIGATLLWFVVPFVPILANTDGSHTTQLDTCIAWFLGLIFLIGILNGVLWWSGSNKRIIPTIPQALNGWLAGGAAIAGGLLIGTTIFT